MNPTGPEIWLETRAIKRSSLLTPQEFALLECIVRGTLEGDRDSLTQKRLADGIGIPSAKQIGVIGTRLRAKLATHLAASPDAQVVRIELPERGYEARFSYRHESPGLSAAAQNLLTNARTAIDQRSLPGAATALKFLREALAHDPGHPRLVALKAYCYSTRALFGTHPRADLERAETILRQSSASVPLVWERAFSEACVRMALYWDWAGAPDLFEQAITLGGSEAQRQPWYCAFLAARGRAAEAVSHLQLAVTRFHDSPVARADLAVNQIMAGYYDEAEDTIQTAMQLFGARAHYLLWVHRAILEEATGRPEAAVTTLRQVPLRWPQTSITLGLRALFSGLAGDRRSARRHFFKLRAARAVAGTFVPAAQLCGAAFGAGDTAAAFHWLREGALVERDPNLLLANVYPFFRHRRREQAFREVAVDAMGLPHPD